MERRVRRWRHGHVAAWDVKHVLLCEDGGTWRVTGPQGERLCDTEAEAVKVVESWTGPGWREVPAVYNARAEPVAPDGPWVKIGNEWLRPDSVADDS